MIKNRVAIVALLTGLNFLNYLDRFIVAAVLPRIKDELHLSNFESGLLATVFLLGYFLTSPLFGKLGDRVSRKRLIAFGVLCWSIATIASGLAGNLYMLLAARVFVGIGEASYATLAPTIIDDISPPDKKGKMLAIFYLAMPVGSALGYVIGGTIQQHWGWREAFFVGGGPGVVLAATCLWIDEPVRKHVAKAAESIVATAKKLMSIVLYRRGVLGYCAHTAAIGAFAFWGPSFLADRFHAEFITPGAIGDAAASEALANAAKLFGTVTVVAGALGTLLGGWMCDRALRGLPPVPAQADHTHPANLLGANAQLRVCAIGVAIAAPMTAAAFLAPTPALFFTFAGLGEVGLFLSTAPINAILLRTAPAWLRASAMAVGIFAIHLLGDLWSPTVIGVLLDHLPSTQAMMILPITFAVAAIIWWPRAREARSPTVHRT